MRKQIAIFIACLVLPRGAVRADNGSVCKYGNADIVDEDLCKKVGGCKYIDNRCEKCKSGTYGENNLCIPCDSNWPHSHLIDADGKIYLGDSAPTGATKPQHCYQECKEHGVHIPGKDHAFKEKTSETAYYPSTCVYTLGCDVSTTTVNGTEVTNVCNSYFAYPSTNINNGSCQPQWWNPQKTPTKPPYVGATTECDEFTENRYYIYVSDKNNINYGKFKCYANTCDAGYVVVPDNNIVCDINNNGTTLTLGQCEPRVKDCNKDTSLSNDCTDLLGRTAAVAGLIEWDDTKQKYNYNKCTCTVMQDITDDYDKKIGTRRFQYGTISNTDGNEASWNTNAPTTQVENCYAGYYESKDPSGNTAKDTCKQTEPGYYSPAPNVDKDDMGGKQRYPCPAGRSSAAGAGSENECGIKRGTDGTKFCDKGGCFTLPPPSDASDVIIKFVGKTN